MNIVLWIIASVLAVAFLAGGTLKLALSKEKLAAAPGGSWAGDFSAGAVKAIGALEVLAAVGLVLPALLDIAPVLVPLAAIGIAVLMVGAAITHLRRHENKVIAANVAYLALAAFVVVGRFGLEPFTG
jgi:hypothetical protein